MAKLTQLIKAEKAALPITMRMERWMIANVDPVYSEAALRFSDDWLRGKVGGKRTRKPGFRASGMGSCARRRVFARVGTPGVSEQFSSAQANTFATGNMFHRKWQMAGLTEGWLTEVEIPYHSDDLDLGGTADGKIWDGSLFEFKSINTRGYKFVGYSQEPKDDHARQVAAYKLLDPALTAASIVYENKDNGEWRELRVEFTDELMTEVQDELEGLRRSVRNQELPKILDACLTKTGTTYRQCPFRDVCLQTKVWPREAA